MSLEKRLRALEQATAGGAEPVEIWSRNQAEPDTFTLHPTGERLSRAEGRVNDWPEWEADPMKRRAAALPQT